MQISKAAFESDVQVGADAVINVRYSSSAVMDGAAEVMAYGTAVRFLS